MHVKHWGYSSVSTGISLLKGGFQKNTNPVYLGPISKINLEDLMSKNTCNFTCGGTSNEMIYCDSHKIQHFYGSPNSLIVGQWSCSSLLLTTESKNTVLKMSKISHCVQISLCSGKGVIQQYHGCLYTSTSIMGTITPQH